jgi:hypothetical protein
MYEPENTEAQKAALRRLETLLALIEGWVDAVVLAASSERMQGAQALTEAMRRRRASGGPAEQTFATLVGLELRPRRLRDAAALWGAMGQLHGASTRDSLWNHPDLLPSSDDLDDPLSYASNYGGGIELSIPDDLSSLTEAADTPEPKGAPGESAESEKDSASDGSEGKDSIPMTRSRTTQVAESPSRRPRGSPEHARSSDRRRPEPRNGRCARLPTDAPARA